MGDKVTPIFFKTLQSPLMLSVASIDQDLSAEVNQNPARRYELM